MKSRLSPFLLLAMALPVVNVLLLNLGYLDNALFCLITVVWMLVLLVREYFPVEITMGMTLLVLLLGSELLPDERSFFNFDTAFSGLQNKAVITIAALFIVATGIKEIGVFNWLSQKTLGRVSHPRGMVLRMAMTLAPLSAFLNNTPIVAIFLPVIRDWANKMGVSPSKLLIPLSYVTLIGGTCTLIGTSTHLIVNGLYASHGHVPFSLFDFGKAALPAAILSIIYLAWIGVRLLPDRKDLMEESTQGVIGKLIEVQVKKEFDKRTINDLGLRDLKNGFLFQVIRSRKSYAPIRREMILQKNDRLLFLEESSSLVEELTEFQKLGGLTRPERVKEWTAPEKANLIEVVISPRSGLVGKSLDDTWFNRRYDASVLSLTRAGKRVEEKMQELPLKGGDTLLLLAGMGFRSFWEKGVDFISVSHLRESKAEVSKMIFGTLIFIAMVCLPVFNILPLHITALLACFTFGLIKILPFKGLFQHIDWSVIITIAASLGISLALERSGASDRLAQLIISFSRAMGPWGALFCLYFVTNVLTETITNNAAAALMFPIGLKLGTLLGISSSPFIMAISIAASASFATPLGYQTHLMVYGPGNYRFSDFLKTGIPINIIFFLISCVWIPIFWPLY